MSVRIKKMMTMVAVLGVALSITGTSNAACLVVGKLFSVNKITNFPVPTSITIEQKNTGQLFRLRTRDSIYINMLVNAIAKDEEILIMGDATSCSPGGIVKDIGSVSGVYLY